MSILPDLFPGLSWRYPVLLEAGPTDGQKHDVSSLLLGEPDRDKRAVPSRG
jgi:hypothetical protein